MTSKWRFVKQHTKCKLGHDRSISIRVRVLQLVEHLGKSWVDIRSSQGSFSE